MFKQIFNKSNGKPKLIKSVADEETGKEYFDYNESDYTEEMPPPNLYEPIHFNNGKWIGVTKGEWLKLNPEVEKLPDDKDILIADLTLQLMQTQDTVMNLQNDMANLTLQVLESDNNA
nr:MAG TPA: hypothetical protein [Caudoviricetes sp.]